MTKELVKRGANLMAYDSEAIASFRSAIDEKTRAGMDFVHNPEQTLEDIDALLILTDWNEFKSPDFGKLRKLMKKPVIFDGRNLYNLDTAKKELLIRVLVGR